MSIAISSRGIWDCGYPLSKEDIALIKRCERDTQLDRESGLHNEGHKPCTSPDKYRPLTLEEREMLKKLLGMN